MDRGFLQTFGAALAAGVFLSAGAFAQQNVGAADMKFAREAATGGMEEVQLGQLAVQNASSDQVKQFGQRMVDDHSKANDQLMALASKENMTLPMQLTAKEQAVVNRLSGLKGTAFDKAYMRDMVRDHEKDIAAFETEASSGTDPGLKDFAGKTLPTLQEHLRLAKDAGNSVGAISMK
jgi:putative membrane protein